MIKENFDDIHYPKNIDEILHKNVDEKMFDHIKRANKDYLNDTSMTYMGESLTYGEFFELVDKYSKALNSYGLQKGDCVTFAMPNIPETVCYFYACNQLGITAYLIDPRSTLINFTTCIKNSNSKLFICEMGTYYKKVAQHINEVPVDNIVVVSPVNMFEKKNISNSKVKMGQYLYTLKKFYEEIKMSKKDSNKKIFQKDFINLGINNISNLDAPYDPEIPAIIVNTSGTTGNSIKGAMHSNRTYNIYTNEAQFVTKHLVRGNTYYGYIPYFTMYGSGVGMHVALNYGIVINNIPKFDGKKTLQDIIDSKVNILIGMPMLIEKLVDMYIEQDADASHVKQYIIGGDFISPEKLNYENNILLSKGMQTRMVYGYGATECMPISTSNYDQDSYLPGSVGMVYPEAYIKIINPENGQQLGYNQEGEIYVHNETLMMGYVNNPESESNFFKEIDGKRYYKTGDRAYLTETGHLFFTGRYKRLMKRPDCHQVTPIPIENAIEECDIVENCSVVGITRENGIAGVIPTAFVVLKNKEKILNDYSKEEIVKQIADEIYEKITGERDIALAYVIVDSLPITKNGKVDFAKLQKNKFDYLDFYAIDDKETRGYFVNMPNLKMIKTNLGKSRTLNKK